MSDGTGLLQRRARWVGGVIAAVGAACGLALALSPAPARATCGASCEVTTLLDDGSAGTLRSIVGTAADGDTITFDSSLSGTITLATPLLVNDSITIDGTGATIAITSGSGSIIEVTSFPVTAEPVTIRNLALNDAVASAISMSARVDLAVDNVVFTDNQVGIAASGTGTGNPESLTVTDSQFIDTVGRSISVADPGFAVDDINITNVTVTDPGDVSTSEGIYIRSAIDVAIVDTSVSGQSDDGIEVFLGDNASGSEPVVITGSNSSNNGGEGIEVGATAGPVTISGSTAASNNGGHGIRITSLDDAANSDDVVLTDVTTDDNGRAGVFVSSAGSVDVDDVSADGNDESGLTANLIDGAVTIDDSTFENTTSTSFNAAGLLLTNIRPVGATLTNVTVSNNASQGLSYTAGGSAPITPNGPLVITGTNSFVGNTQNGIRVLNGTSVSATDATATGNLIGLNVGTAMSVVVSGSTFDDSDLTGASLFAVSDSVQISNTSMSDNTLNGLLVRPGGFPLVTTDTVTLTSVDIDDNLSLGADINATGAVAISNGSSIDGNGSVPEFPSVGYGLSVDTQGAVSLGDTSIDGNGSEGLVVESAGSLTTNGASIDGNGDHGVLIESITGTSTLTGGTISENATSGVEVQPPGASDDAGDITFDGVAFTGNPIGLDFNTVGGASADALTIANSTFTGHTGLAIDVIAPGDVTIDDTGVLNPLGGSIVGDGVSIAGATSVAIIDMTVSDQDGDLSIVSTAGDVDITGGSVTGSVVSGVGINGVTGTTTVDGLVASGNGTGGGPVTLTGLFLLDVVDVVITDVVADDNPSSGISVSATGSVSVTGGSTSNNSEGLRVDMAGGDVLIDGVDANDNTNLGISVGAGAGATQDVSIANATADRNATFGIVINPASDVSITSTNSRANGWDGTRISNADAVVVSGLTSTGNTGGVDPDGLDVRNAESLSIAASTLSQNESRGLDASDISGAVEIDGTTMTGNGAEGGEVAQATGQVTLTDVTITANQDDGLAAREVGGFSISDSSVSSNTKVGLDLDDPGAVAFARTNIDENFEVGAPVGSGSGVDLVGATSLAIDGGTISDNGGVGLSGSVSGPVDFGGAVFDDNAGGGALLPSAGSVTVEGGGASRNGGAGMLFGDPTTVDISFVTASDNTGAGISLSGPGGAVMVDSAKFLNNGGAGVSVSSGLFAVMAGSVSVTDSEFTGNKDGVSLNSATSLAVSDSTFREQVTAGVSVSDSTGTVTVEDSRMTDNGRGIDVRTHTGDIEVRRVVIVDGDQPIEIDDLDGSLLVEKAGVTRANGGIAAEDVTGSVTIDRSALYTNGPTSGTSSALDLLRVVNVGGGLDIVNSTISTNNVVRLIDATSTSVNIRHSTVAENNTFAIVNSDSAVVVDHSILEAPGQRVVLDATAPSATLTATHSIVPLNTGLGGSTIEVTNALIQPTIVTDESTFAYVPAVGSPAIDAGDPAITGQPATDQRGGTRIVDVIDIGSIETVPSVPALISLEPARFVDTRTTGDTFDDEFEGDGKRTAGSEYTVTIAGRGGVPADAAGVVMNVTAIAVEGTGFVTVHPCVTPRPLSSSLNYVAGVNLGNELIAGLSDAGTTCLFTSQPAHLAVDVTGYIPAGSSTTPTTPARFLDTRPAGETVDEVAQGDGRTTAGGTIELDIAGRGDIPGDAKAVIVNVTAIGAQGTGFVTVHPCVDPIPLASSLNFVAGVNRGNELVASLDATGKLCIFTSASIHVTADVVGYLPSDSTVASVDPARLLDTRPNGETVDDESVAGGKIGPDDQITIDVAGRAGVLDDATAVVINVTAIGAESTGFVTVHPCADPRPLASSLNYVAGVNGGNEIVALLSGDGDLCLYSSARTHLAVDVVAYLPAI